ncbi:hypothetical protein VTK56DRAFT_312 [Thermocarpiscus australiensis]
MASDRGPTATEAPRAALTSAIPQTTAASFASVADLSRQKPLKRARETTPDSSEAVSLGDISPSKIARLVGFARQSHPSSAGSPGENETSGQGEAEQQHLAQLDTSNDHNPTQRAVDDLMSSVVMDMNRPQDVPSETGRSEIEAAAAAAARALSSVAIPTGNGSADNNIQDVSPQSGTSAPGMEDGEGQVVDSPAAMHIDSHNDQQAYAPQPEAQMEDKAPSSLSYPGLLPPGNSSPAPAPSQRVMSMPTPSSHQIPDLAPRSPSSKKQKCPYCEAEFTRQHNLKSHLLTHSQEKPYVCQSCQMRFRRLHDLKRHSKLHTGEKPHVCPNCDRKFARGDALARHSKGAGGCAGRRPGIGQFGLRESFDESGAEAANDSAMSGALYEGGSGADMTEEERQRLKAQPVTGQAGAEVYSGHSNAYPPAGQRPGVAGALYPPNADRGSASSNTSPSVPNSHTPHTSVSSMPLSAGSTSMYSQSGMTESPKPLSPGAGQQRPASEQYHGAPGMSQPSHGNNAGPSQHAAGRGRGRAASGAVPAPQGAQNAVSSGSDPGLWAYFQHLEEKVKNLTNQLGAEARSKMQLLEKVDAHDQHIAALTAEIAVLRRQLAESQQQVQVQVEGSAADPAADSAAVPES